MRESGTGCGALLLVMSLMSVDGALAQQANTDGGGQLETIVVTATKRASTVQDTAISLTAVSGQEIAARGLTDFTSLAQSVPGLSMRTSGAGQTEFEMRGMTSGGGNSATVGFYLDDTPLTAPANAQNGKVVIDPNLYDLNRVEVLRGPQGTLYGSGSMGGTIKLVPNAPNPAAFDASAEAILSGTDGGGLNHAQNVMVNLPLGSTAAVRIVSSHAHESGWIDRVVMTFNDALLAFPGILLALGLLSVFGANKYGIILALGLAYTPSVARIMRGTVLSVRELEFVAASRVIGNGTAYTLFRHILPNCLAPLTVLTTSMFGWAILAESALSFLGLGVPPPAPTWGNMLASSRPYLGQAAWLGIFPGVCIALALLGINLLGDTLRDRLDPRMKGT